MDAITTTTQHTVATVTRLATADRVDLDTLAWAVVEDGTAAHTAQVLGLVLEARELGVDTGLLALLADDTASEIARQRAFGQVATAVASLRRSLPHPADILSA